MPLVEWYEIISTSVLSLQIMVGANFSDGRDPTRFFEKEIVQYPPNKVFVVLRSLIGIPTTWQLAMNPLQLPQFSFKVFLVGIQAHFSFFFRQNTPPITSTHTHTLNNMLFVFFSMNRLGQGRTSASHITKSSFVKESVCVSVVYSRACILKRKLRTSDYVPHFPQPWMHLRVKTWPPKIRYFSLLQLLLEQNTSSVSCLVVSPSNVSVAFTNFTFETLKKANLLKIDAFGRGKVNNLCKYQWFALKSDFLDRKQTLVV